MNKTIRITSKQDVVNYLLADRHPNPIAHMAYGFAPANIALCKYWGKRNEELNLPVTDSLSISLGDLGSKIKIYTGCEDSSVLLNGNILNADNQIFIRTQQFLDLFFKKDRAIRIELENNIPTAAGCASSASGFAAMVRALNALFEWNLDLTSLSILARLGSGSACRSIFEGLVIWHAGSTEDGMDSYGEPLGFEWPELNIGVVVLSEKHKHISSRDAMKHSVETSMFYKLWPESIKRDILDIRKAISKKDFNKVGCIAESNALRMHALMMTSEPPVLYWIPESVHIIERVWEARKNGICVYFTIDAGPNIKLLYHFDEKAFVSKLFPELLIVN